MSKDQELVPAGKLSEIMTANAKIAMPEMVSIFLSKYENALYEKKDTTQEEMNKLDKDWEIAKAVILKKADFKKYLGAKLPGFKAVTRMHGEPSIDWEQGIYEATISLVFIGDKKDQFTDSGFRYRATHPVAASDLKTKKDFEKRRAELQAQLSATVAKIGNMARKERQVKARISEMRLEEAGLTDFLQDKEMQALIEI